MIVDSNGGEEARKKVDAPHTPRLIPARVGGGSLADETRRNYGLSVEARRAEKKNMELALEEEGRFWNKVSGQRRANTLLRSVSSTANLYGLVERVALTSLQITARIFIYIFCSSSLILFPVLIFRCRLSFRVFISF